MKKRSPKSNRNQSNNTSNHTSNIPGSDQAPARALAALAPADTPRPRPARSDQPPPKRIALVENDPDSILTLEKILQTAPADWRLEIHSSTEQALREITARPPSVVLIATGLPGLPAAECAHRLRVLVPTLPILTLAARADAFEAAHALTAGARGHLIKPVCGDEFLSALDAVLQGQVFLCRRTQGSLVEGMRHSAGRVLARLLSPREEPILSHVSQGKLNKEIASDLGISIGSVHAHMTNLFAKLHVHDRRAACRLYQGLGPPR